MYIVNISRTKKDFLKELNLNLFVKNKKYIWAWNLKNSFFHFLLYQDYTIDYNLHWFKKSTTGYKEMPVKFQQVFEQSPPETQAELLFYLDLFKNT